VTEVIKILFHLILYLKKIVNEKNIIIGYITGSIEILWNHIVRILISYLDIKFWNRRMETKK